MTWFTRFLDLSREQLLPPFRVAQADNAVSSPSRSAQHLLSPAVLESARHEFLLPELLGEDVIKTKRRPER